MTSQGPATREQMEELHRLLVDRLLKAFSGPRGPSLELLAVVRALLRQEHVQAYQVGTGRVRQIQRLHDLYARALLHAVEQGNTSATLLTEVGAFLRASGWSKDINADPPMEQALRKLADPLLPFK